MLSDDIGVSRSIAASWVLSLGHLLYPWSADFKAVTVARAIVPLTGRVPPEMEELQLDLQDSI
jgi:hypothetical protein